VLSALLAVLTYQIARRNFVDQRRGLSVSQTLANAAQARDGLGSLPVETVYESVGGDRRRVVIVTESATVGPVELVRPMRSVVASGTSAWQVVRTDEGPALIVGVPIRVGDAQDEYYEITSLADISSTLTTLLRSLLVGGALTTIAGAGLGMAVSGRVVRPLRDIAVAASEIASGRLDTRLAGTGDSDLEPLVSSFNDMAASLQGRLEREARFASDVSHELRTPLTAMSAAAQLLTARREELSERGQTALEVLTTQVDHFRRLVLDLLEISRFDAQAAELVHEPIDLVDLVTQVAGVHGLPSGDVDASRLADRVADVDKRRIERILTNLLQNAANYGGGATAVELSEASLPGVDRAVRIDVVDAGPGVPDEEKARIFERFTRGSAQLAKAGPKGTGLGLSLVAEHVRLHRGRAWVEDAIAGDPGLGARFVVELAAPPPHSGPHVHAATLGAATAVAPTATAAEAGSARPTPEEQA
jgi:signal transduction histidine kinase